MQSLINRNIHIVKGQVARWAHAGLPDGTYEEEWGRYGFSGPVTHLYHLHPPTGWKAIDGPLRPHALAPLKMPVKDGERGIFLYNPDVAMGIECAETEWDYFFRNGEADEVLFVHTGSGRIETQLGPLNYRRGDYLHLPRGTTYRLIPKEATTLLTIEAFSGPLQQPDRGLIGQHALYDPAILEYPEPSPDKNLRAWKIRVKRLGAVTTFTYDHSPMDVVGYKGDNLVWRLNIDDICPVNSHKMHLPPPAHTTFVGVGFVICSFLPRPLETMEGAVKVPFYHSNVDYDEVLFYHDGDFFSRSGIEAGMVTLHPGGFPHGPHPKAVRRTDTKVFTDEAAVMLDTWRPLVLTPEAEAVEWREYWSSWME
ncbi:MAG: homogentisate 1,2-dioxygenase [Calditrichaeota bacterium]|nr:homogentisate 1,2-dioxygenase [Calditrichota bacterium]